jgi:hypothetical protein
MTLDKSYIGYLGFLGIDFLKSVLMYSKGTICLSRLLFKMGLFTVQCPVSGKRFSNMQSNETRHCLTYVSICVPTVQTEHTVTLMQLLLK